MKLHERYVNMSDFEELLEEAENAADNEWRRDFVKDIRARYTEFGIHMWLSDKQKNVLMSIAFDGAP